MKHSMLVAVLYLWALPSLAATYYISPTGNDSNAGTSIETSWASPKHSLNCGDVIVAAPGSYSAANFNSGDWGTVTCADGNNVAWLTCQTFDACKITATSYQGMWISKSYWGVQGWEITSPSTNEYGTCFFVSPPDRSPTEITHIIVANNVANGCSNYGYASNYVGGSAASPDYVVFIGNIAYNAATGGTAGCASGFSILQPYQSDTVAGTHIYIAGNFSYKNLDADPCDGTRPTDGEGIILDGLAEHGYTQQVAVANNIVVYNGSEGILVGGVGGSTGAHVYVDHNTSYSNITDPKQSSDYDVGEIGISGVSTGTPIVNMEASYNLAVLPPTTPTGASTSVYALSMVYGNSSSAVDYNWAYGPGGHSSTIYSSGSFAYGSHNTFGTDPVLTNPVVPGAPSCSGTANVPACMETLIANFTPLTQGALSYGYQRPSTEQVYDPLFPQWLCNVDLPSGLVTMGCFRLHLSATVS